MAETMGLDKLLGGVSVESVKAGVYDMAYWIIWGIVALAIIVFAYLKYQDKKIYIYPVRIFRQRANGLVKEQNVWGGYVKKNNITTFSLKMTAWKKRKLDKLPLSELMDEENRVYYWQVSPDAPLIQVEKKFIVEQILVPDEKFVEPTKDERDSLFKKYLVNISEEEEYKDLTKEQKESLALQFVEDEISARRNKLIDITKPTYSPVPTDTKQMAMAEINNYRATLGVDTNKQMAYFITGVIALVILGTIIFYIAVNQGDIPILTK
jgi:hypothetical protein